MKNLIEYYKKQATGPEQFCIVWIPSVILILILYYGAINRPQIPADTPTPAPSPITSTSDITPPPIDVNTPQIPVDANQTIRVTGSDTVVYINGKRVQ